MRVAKFSGGSTIAAKGSSEPNAQAIVWPDLRTNSQSQSVAGLRNGCWISIMKEIPATITCKLWKTMGYLCMGPHQYCGILWCKLRAEGTQCLSAHCPTDWICTNEVTHTWAARAVLSEPSRRCKYNASKNAISCWSHALWAGGGKSGPCDLHQRAHDLCWSPDLVQADRTTVCLGGSPCILLSAANVQVPWNVHGIHVDNKDSVFCQKGTSCARIPCNLHMWTLSPAKGATFFRHCIQPYPWPSSSGRAQTAWEGSSSTNLSFNNRVPILSCSSLAWLLFFLCRQACWMPLPMSFFQYTPWCTKMSCHCGKCSVGSPSPDEVLICCHTHWR